MKNTAPCRKALLLTLALGSVAGLAGCANPDGGDGGRAYGYIGGGDYYDGRDYWYYDRDGKRHRRGDRDHHDREHNDRDHQGRDHNDRDRDRDGRWQRDGDGRRDNDGDRPHGGGREERRADSDGPRGEGQRGDGGSRNEGQRDGGSRSDGQREGSGPAMNAPAPISPPSGGGHGRGR